MAQAMFCTSAPDILNFLQSNREPDYLAMVSDFVSIHKGETSPLKSPKGARWTVGGVRDTEYRDKPREVEGWGMFYLPEEENMQVLGIVVGTEYCHELVLMTCDDETIYGYDGEELHKVASSLTQLCVEGIRYPASNSYYNGEAFEDVTQSDWDKVKKGPVGKSLDEAHHKLVTAEKSQFLQDLKYSQRMSRQEEYLKQQELFRRNAFLVIKEMVRLSSGIRSMLVDEVLQSIFFLGEINNPRFTPANIVSDADMLNALKGNYPEPFQRCSTQVPRRSPISCVLDMVVLLTGRDRENQILSKLQTLMLQLKEGEAVALISATICVSQPDKTPNSDRYYGVSMSTSGRNPGRIMVAASCLSTWEIYVAGAVMTYFPEREKKAYFDGTIKLPGSVRCQAFRISTLEPMPPCTKCGELFGLHPCAPCASTYGNCAEAESLSNLFKNEQGVKDASRPTSTTYTDANLQRARESVKKTLKDILRMLHFNWDENFYTPQ